MDEDENEIRQWTAKDGTIFIDKGDGERIIVRPDPSDPTRAGGVYETGGREED
jgi:hypothetical protein